MQRRLLFLILAVLLPVAAASAQTPPTSPAPDTAQTAPPPPPHKPHPGKETQKLVQQLTLTPDQEAKVKPIVVDRDQQISAVEADSTISPAEQKKKVRVIRRDFVAKLEAVLTEKQKQTFDAARANKRGAAEPTPTPPAPPAPQL